MNTTLEILAEIKQIEAMLIEYGDAGDSPLFTRMIYLTEKFLILTR